MLTRRRSTVVGTLTTAALLLTVAVGLAAPAAAAGGPCRGVCEDADATSGSGSITVAVRGTAMREGGETASIPTSSVRTHPVCWYGPFISGKEYAENWGPDGLYTGLNGGIPGQVHLPEEDRFAPYDGYLEYAEDTEGLWWTPRCSSRYWPGEDLDGWSEYTQEYFAGHDAVYVQPGDVPPQADVPPEVLAEIAFDQMDLPVGDVAWNPTREGDGATFVGMDTWVWVENALTEVSVTASVSTGTWATVRAGLDSLQVSAPGAGTVTCDGPGVPWSEGADPGAACAVVFDRSSANQPVKSGFSVPTATMSATARWTASWTSSLDSTPTELPTQEVTSTAEVPVAEVQSLVTG